MKPFKDSINIDAHFYLDDSGDEITRTQFIQDMYTWGNDTFMLYVGGGFVPLRIAIHAYSLTDAYGTFEEWARNNDRLDEIGESDPCDEHFGQYESVHQVITQAMTKPFLVEKYSSPLEWLNSYLNSIEDLEQLRYLAITLANGHDFDFLQDTFEREMDRMGYFMPKVEPVPWKICASNSLPTCVGTPRTSMTATVTSRASRLRH